MKYLPLVVTAIVTLIVGPAGLAKLMGVEVVHKSFADLGLPVWFGYFIGACELAGAIGLWLRPTSRLAAIGIAIIMVGALYYHVTVPPIAAGVPALIVLLGCGFIIQRKGTGVIG